MAEMTLTEALLQLAQVNIAIQDLMLGKRVSELQVGTGEFTQRYKFGEVTLESLLSYRNELRAVINSLSANPTPIFRNNSCIPLVVLK